MKSEAGAGRSHLVKAGDSFGTEFSCANSMETRRIEAGILDNITDMDMTMTPFQAGLEIIAVYPEGVLEIADGGTFDAIAGQPTDDSEMALLLARSLISEQRFDADKVLEAYQYWLSTGPFDSGVTIRYS